MRRRRRRRKLQKTPFPRRYNHISVPEKLLRDDTGLELMEGNGNMSTFTTGEEDGNK